MLTNKELTWIIISILLMSFVISVFSDLSSLLAISLSGIIILVSVFSKKLAATYFNVKIEHKAWEFQRYWFHKVSHLKKPIPMGLLFPFIISILSAGIIRPLTFLQFDAKNSKKRILKKRGAHRHQEINESDLAFVAFWGFIGLILLSILGVLTKQPELTRYSLYYGLWNLIPFSQLDGTKLFFGSLVSWILIIVIYLISLLLVLLTI